MENVKHLRQARPGRPPKHGATLVRKDLLLTPDQIAAIERISRETSLSMSEVARDLIGIGLERRDVRSKPDAA